MKLITFIKNNFKKPKYALDKYPIIKEVSKIACHVPYDYDTVYEVWINWNKDIEATKSAFDISKIMHIDVHLITQESMNNIAKCISTSGFSMKEASKRFEDFGKHYNDIK